jgi:hypothetical protein
MSGLRKMTPNFLNSYSAEDTDFLETVQGSCRNERDEVYPALLNVLTPMELYICDIKVN